MLGTGGLNSSRNCSSIVVDDRILFDCGNGIVKTMLKQNVDVNKIDTVFITHLHGDHFLDIPLFILARRSSIRQLNAYYMDLLG